MQLAVNDRTFSWFAILPRFYSRSSLYGSIRRIWIGGETLQVFSAWLRTYCVNYICWHSAERSVRATPSCGAYQRLYSPGGLLNDKDVIAAADEAGIAMVFSGVRQFRH
jgi:hypothetical protein